MPEDEEDDDEISSILRLRPSLVVIPLLAASLVRLSATRSSKCLISICINSLCSSMTDVSSLLVDHDGSGIGCAATSSGGIMALRTCGTVFS